MPIPFTVEKTAKCPTVNNRFEPIIFRYMDSKNRRVQEIEPRTSASVHMIMGNMLMNRLAESFGGEINRCGKLRLIELLGMEQQ
jgi:hypothetical protein